MAVLTRRAGTTAVHRTAPGGSMPAPSTRPTRGVRAAALAALLALASALPARAGTAPPVGAQAGLDLARSAAGSWAADAALIYIENDEPIDAAGHATRWGYLFYSPTRDAARAWSVHDGHIVAAEDLAMRFSAPPLGAGWIDSDAALAAARGEVARAFPRQVEVRLTTMLLLRGAFDDSDPDRATWTLVYSAPGEPGLFVMIDAADGRVRRTWRG
jgi:hypothetical protein